MKKIKIIKGKNSNNKNSYVHGTESFLNLSLELSRKRQQVTQAFTSWNICKANFTGFTLVELIVVITIVAILGTIAFIALQGYSRDSRDSVRISDMGRMKTGLELFKLESGKYPIPTDGDEITFSGDVLVWTQGYFGESVYSNIEKLDKIPKDPKTDMQYVYSTTNTRQEFQLAGVMEGDEVSYQPHLNKKEQPHPNPLLKENELTTNINNNSTSPLGEGARGGGLFGVKNVLASNKIARLKITGNYNGKLMKVKKSSTDYILALPSIMTSNGTELETIIANKTLAYNGYKNLPTQFASNYKTDGETSLNLVNTGSYVVFSGSLSDLSQTNKKQELITNLKTAYSGTDIESVGEIAEIINTSDEDTKQIEILANAIVSNNLGGSVNVSSKNNTTRQEPTTILGNDGNTVLLIQSDIDYSLYTNTDTFETKNTDYWKFYENSNYSQYAGNISIDNNKIKFQIPINSNSRSQGGTGIQSYYKINGDFDISSNIDSSLLISNDSGMQSQIRIYIAGKAYTWGDYKLSGVNNFRFYTDSSSCSLLHSSINYNPNTTYKIIREGNVLTLKYLNSNVIDWTTFTTCNSVGYDNVIFGLWSYPDASGSSVEHYSYFDNFSINSGTIVYDKVEDSSSSNHTITNNGDLFHSSTQKKFGQTSIYFDGNGDYLSLADSNDWDFGNDDFTIDAWIYPTLLEGDYRVIFGFWGDNINNNRWQFLIDPNQSLFFSTTSGITGHNEYKSSNSIISLNNWQHIAIVRKGNTITVYHNGIEVVSGTYNEEINFIGSEGRIGRGNLGNGGDHYFKGYMDEIRISKGIARWTENFTPPNLPYGN